MQRILVVSDSHGRDENVQAAVDAAGRINAMIHLGDVGPNYQMVAQMARGVSAYIVRGNCDSTSELMDRNIISVAGHNIYATHGHRQQVNYDLEHISIAGLTMDVDFFIVGEVKGTEAVYLLNAAYTGQLCAATIHAPSADKATDKLVDYCLAASKYTRNELMKMLDCFKTLVFMEHYRVKEIFECKGWNEETKNLIYERIL